MLQQHPPTELDIVEMALGCISTAIKQSNHDLVKFIVSQHTQGYTPKWKPLTNPFKAAIRKRDIDTIETLLSAFSANVKLREWVSQSLTTRAVSLVESQHNYESRHEKDLFSRILRIVLPYTKPTIGWQPFRYVCNVAELGHPSDIEYLVSEGVSLAEPTSMLRHESALSGPAKTGDVDMLNAILDSGFFTNASVPIMETAVRAAAGEALLHVNISVYHELWHRFSTIIDETRLLSLLALAHGTISHMKDWMLKYDSMAIDEQTKACNAPLQHNFTYGGCALKIAIRNFRWENVQFLLANQPCANACTPSVPAKVAWTRWVKRQADFEKTQETLRNYNLEPIEIGY